MLGGALVMSTNPEEIHKAAHWSTALTNLEVLCVSADPEQSSGV